MPFLDKSLNEVNSVKFRVDKDGNGRAVNNVSMNSLRRVSVDSDELSFDDTEESDSSEGSYSSSSESRDSSSSQSNPLESQRSEESGDRDVTLNGGLVCIRRSG